MSEPGVVRYVLAFLALVIGATFFLPWREADWWLHGKLARVEPPRLTDRLLIIDVPHDDNPGVFRTRVGDVMRALAKQPQGAPMIVLVDIVFAREENGQQSVVDGLSALRAAGSRIYGAVDPADNGRIDPDYPNRLNNLIYSAMDGVGHTVFGIRGESAAYAPAISTGKGRPSLAALVQVVAVNHFDAEPSQLADPVPLAMGALQEFWQRTVTFDGNRFLRRDGTELSGIRNHVVLIGALAKDVSIIPGRTGPELIAWALNRHLVSAAESKGRALLAHPGLLLSLLTVAVVVAVGVAALLFKLMPGTHSHLWVLPTAGGCVALAFLVAIALASIALNHTMPQITLIVLSVFGAAALTGIYLYRYQRWQDTAGAPEAIAADYDVFISYSRSPENSRWVDRHVVQPLATVTKADGSTLRVFRDTDRIRVGDPWFHRIVHALNASRCFVPIYSEDYFSKIPCVKEMERAAQKEFTRNDFLILPISRLPHAELMKSEVFKTYDKYQYVDAGTTPDFVERVAQRIVQG